VYVKLEKFNLSGSVKDRAALGMIEAAEKEGLLKEGSVIIEPTSGNTGIALALIGRLKGYKVIIVMPDTMSIERRATLKAYGAELILTDGTKGMGEAIAVAEKLAAENPNYFLPQQFNNKANPEKHYETTGKELLDDFKVIDAFVAGVGTGGTIVGVAKRLKERSKDTKVVGVEPSTSAVLSGEKPGKHSIQGIGTGFIPKNYDASVVDEIVKISSEEALEYAKKASHDFGLFVGISSGANIAAAYQVAKKLGKVCVAVCDCRYVYDYQKLIYDIYVNTPGLGGKIHWMKENRKICRTNFQYLTTTEMLSEFSFLNNGNLVEDIVVNNTHKIANMIDDNIEIIKKKLYVPNFDNSDKKLKDLVLENAKKIYGDKIDERIKQRIEKELNSRGLPTRSLFWKENAL